jgi:N-carbamoyl-L-amino-acid hydrolase
MSAEWASEATGRLLAAIDALPRERLAFSRADVAARVVVADHMQGSGMEAMIDDAFNVVGRLEGMDPTLRPLVVASHTDTVPDPGRLDGALGVFAGIECARALAAIDRRLRHPLLVIDFSDEEGSTTYGCWGSRAVAGALTPGEKAALAEPESALRVTLVAGGGHLAELGRVIRPLEAPVMGRIEPAAYLELHIEQGPVLERVAVATAAVTAIVGIERYEVRLGGVSGHAGTVPMADRDDAVLRAAVLVETFWKYVLGLGSQAVTNFGRVNVEPGSYNVIPSAVSLGVEVRSPEPELVDQMRARLSELAAGAGGQLEVIGHEDPLPLSAEIIKATRESADAEGIACRELPSWAGHDAGVFAPRTPTGMIFVPSIDGVSHSPAEATRQTDIALGLRLLLATLRRLDERL